MLDQWPGFAHELPMWCHQDGPHRGAPLSWAHYVVGIDWLSRQQARRQLWARDAAFMAQPGVKQDSYNAWKREHMLAAEWV